MAIIHQDNQKTYINTATTTQVATGGNCILVAIVVNTTAAGAIGIIDDITGTTVNVGQLKASVAEGAYMYNCTMAKGIRIVTAAASDITVVWKQL
jgi:hypothetical protein